MKGRKIMIVEQKDFSTKLRQLKNVVPIKTITEIKGVLFKDNMLQANNSELALTAKIDIDSSEEFIIPEKAIELIEKLPDGVIDIHLVKDKVIVNSEYGTSRFATAPVSEFQQIDTSGEKAKAFEYNAKDIVEAIRKVIYAINPNNQQAFSGLLLQSDGEYLNFVGCDGNRLVWNKVKFKGSISAIIPKSTIEKILTLTINSNIDIYTIGNKNAIINSDEYTIYTRLISGKYMDYKSHFEKEYEFKAAVNRLELLDCLNRALICTDSVNKSPTVISVSNGKINIEIKTGSSEFKESVKFTGNLPDDMKIGINAKYLVDALRNFDSESVEIHYNTPVTAIRLCKDDLKALVLPIRLSA